MLNFDFTQFDQINLFFLIAAGIGLVRERRILPFVIVLVGALLHGLFPALLLAGLILWHRIDLECPRWVLLKDVFGFFLLLVAAVSPEPIQEFTAVFGILFLSFSFGQGLLGVIPPLLLLRQYQTHPMPIEVILGSAGLYWAAAEGIRWSKSNQKTLLILIFETLCTVGILFGLKDASLKWFEDVPLVILGAVFVLVAMVLAAWLKWRPEGFLNFYRNLNKKLANSFSWGNRFVSAADPFAKERAPDQYVELDGSFNRLFILVVATLISLAAFLLISRGGFN